MKITAVLVSILIGCAMLSSCISFKIKSLPTPDNVVLEFSFCDQIDSSGELLKPEEVKSFFAPDVPDIFCFIKLESVSRRIKLFWLWYDPDGQLAKRSKEVLVNPEEKYLELVTAYDRLSLGEKPRIPGKWKVAVFVNDGLIATRTFQINENNVE